MTNPSPEDLLMELRRVAGELGKSPTASEMREHGQYSPAQYSYRFGSWNAAKEQVDLDTISVDVDRDALLAELKRLGEELDKTPSQQEMNDQGKFSPTAFYSAFDSWNNALAEAGFEPNGRKNISDEELLGGIRDLADELGKAPSQREMDSDGPFSAAVYRKRFGSWSAAKERALK